MFILSVVDTCIKLYILYVGLLYFDFCCVLWWWEVERVVKVMVLFYQ